MAVVAHTPEPGEAEADIVSMTIPAAMQFVRLVRIGAASIGRRRGMSVRAIDDLRLAIDETFSLLLDDRDHDGSVDVTFEIDDHELLINTVVRLANAEPAAVVDPDAIVRFEVVLTDLVDRFDADPTVGVAQFSKQF